ncbi:HAD family hydrolase [Candidatus Uhrbacteria bacterium]|nr:HAD family hydrolase [Candidatus Uhrbacteria bacterium]
MDGTNCVFEIQASDPLLAPHGRRQVWADAVTSYAREKFGFEINPNPITLWRAMTEARRTEPRERDGRRISAEEYLLNVNLRALRFLQAQSMLPIEIVTTECAAAMHHYHRRKDQLEEYTIYPDMADFIRWIAVKDGLNADLFMVTTQQLANIDVLFSKTNRGLRRCFSDIISSEQLDGLEKLSVEFWQRVFARVGVEAATTVMIGSNGISDGYAAEAGARAVFILDRDGTQEDYFRWIMRQETSRSVPLVGHDQPLPRGRFFTFIRELDQSVKSRLLSISGGVLP